MNYYPFHVGDYAAHTAHLEPMEDLAYRRMLDLYYLRECPLPDDPAEVARLIRMRSNVEAVQSVLGEFFTPTDAGWSHKRCAAELDRMQDKQAKAKASAAASVKARSTNAQRTLNERSTGVELPTPTPTPTPKEESAQDCGESVRERLQAEGHKPTAAGTICKAMRQAGLMSSNPGDPRLLALLAQGATEAEFVGIAAEAYAGGKGFAWVLKVLESRRAEAASINLAPAVQAVDVGRIAVEKTANDLADLAAHALRAQGPEAQAARLAVMARRHGAAA